MRTFPFETWDVFTDQAFAGNPLAVVTDARGLSDAEMQAIAREFNLSETTFILPPDGADHDAWVRIFVPTHEIPFAGHPTIGTALSIAAARGSAASLTLRLGAGDFPVRFDDGGAVRRATFVNPNRPTARGAAVSSQEVAAALSLPAEAVASGGDGPRVAGAGIDFLFARLAGVTLAAIKPDPSRITALYKAEAAEGLVVFADAEEPHADYSVRMFAPGAGISEDPATGSAACALPAVLAKSGALKGGAYQWRVRQGVDMGRPSDIHVAFDYESDGVGPVAISGGAVRVQKGELTL